MAELAQIFTTICLPVLAAMGLGWLLDRKFGLDLNTLVKINIYLLVPCFIFTRVASSQLGSAEAGKIILFTAAVIACMFLLSSAASMARRHPAGSRASLRLATMFYNSGNFGLPVVTLAFGEFGAAIQVFVLLTMNISTFTVGLFIASGGDGTRKGLWARLSPILRQPAIYGVTAGILVKEFRLPVQDAVWLWKPAEMMADALVGFALVTLGAQLSKTKPPNLLRGGVLGWALGIRLAAGPLCAAALAHAFGFPPDWIPVLILGACSPTAVNTALLAHEFNADSRTAAAAVFYSTLLSPIAVVAALALAK
ncbi:MAG: AEC family transporter [Verrucomicrobiales bacterium]